MIFVDSTPAIHLVSDDERRTNAAQLLLERAITAGDRLVTDAAAVHEILQHFTEIGCPEAIEPTIDLLLSVADDILAVEQVDVVRAKEILYGPERMSPNACLHLAIMERHGVARIMSFDTTYDRYSAVSRLTP
jgi:predicted nucleic acid-binding protein